MPHYVSKALERIDHIFSENPEHSPAAHTPINYGSKVQYAEIEENLPLLRDKEIKMIQIIVGIFIYYGIAIDNTILVTLNDIAGEQSKATGKTTQQIVKLLNNLATHPLAIIEYHACGIVLYVHSDGSYLLAPRARSRAGGVHFLSNAPPLGTNFEHYTPLLNGFIYVVCKIIKRITSSAAETEFGTLFINAKEAVIILMILHTTWIKPLRRGE